MGLTNLAGSLKRTLERFSASVHGKIVRTQQEKKKNGDHMANVTEMVAKHDQESSFVNLEGSEECKMPSNLKPCLKRKPRLPTPPNSPKLTYNNTTSNTFKQTRWSDSDDSGKGDSEWSEASEDYSTTVFAKQMQISPGKARIKSSVGQYGDELRVLKLAEKNIRGKISKNHEEIFCFLSLLSKTVKSVHVDRISSYVVDLEKITFLLHGLARRLATAEMKIRMTKTRNLLQEEKEEWLKRHRKLSSQFEEAKDIKKVLDKKYQSISVFLEENLHYEARLLFDNLMDEKIKLMITFKEVEDKIKVHAELSEL